MIESVLAVFDPALAPPSLAATSLAGDVKLALSGQDPAQTWVTRSVTRTSAGASRELVFEHATAAERALVPVLVDSSGCRVPSFAPAPAPYLPPRESPAPVDDYGYSPDHGSAVYVTTDASCSGNSRSSDDDSCSGDSASSGDDSCSGDSSASSDDDSCSGDSGSSEDESCSGSSASTDDEDEACVNASARAPARGSSGRPRRTRVSVWTLALAATWLPIRRRRRPL